MMPVCLVIPCVELNCPQGQAIVADSRLRDEGIPQNEGMDRPRPVHRRWTL
jgi:hypothetical protein